MPSLLSGYEYDIFISYRQKDNRGDRWVSKFIEALRTELEASFKEDVSVYFDENPHDRLQETHNVDKSLEGKLNCLILIPILSQTYCDPNSYAWQYEFLAFLRMAGNDHFGKDVRLRSGNVASRILPIRIHDLEQEDIKLFEKETGSVLRAMDFVFKTSTGVSRPLKDTEDHPQDNLNRTFYNDQINKVGHAIKEIILGMKAEPALAVKEKDHAKGSFVEIKEEERMNDPKKHVKLAKRKVLSGVVFLAILIIASVFAYSKIFKKNTLDKLRSSGERISVAVMPFQNMTNDTIWNVWQDGIQNNLITYLSNSEELQVRQLESITGLLKSKGLNNYSSITPSLASSISQKMGANVFIYGSINQAGSTIRLNAQLIDSNTKEVLKSFQIDGIADMIISIIDSLSWKVKDFLIISKLKKEELHDYKYFTTTYSPEAYRNFIFAENSNRRLDYTTAINYYLQAIDIDSNFTAAALMLSIAYLNNRMYDQAKKWCLKVYEKRDMMPLQQKIYTNWVYAMCFETPQEEIKYLRQIQRIDDQLPSTYFSLGNLYIGRLFQYDKAIPEFEKSLELYNKFDSKPKWVRNYTGLGLAYHKTSQYSKEHQLYKKAELDFPNDPTLIYRQAILSLTEADTILANQYIEKYKLIFKDQSWPESEMATSLGNIYKEAEILNRAEGYYRVALTKDPQNPLRLNTLAYFLIDTDRNISEGMDLVETALELQPDNYTFLACKGWGLFKQGNYQEALEILQESWDLRRKLAYYNHEAFIHLEAAKKAIAEQRKN